MRSIICNSLIFLSSFVFFSEGIQAADTATSNPGFVQRTIKKVKDSAKNTIKNFKTGEKEGFQKVKEGAKEALNGHLIQGSKEFYKGVGQTITSVPLAGKYIKKAAQYEVAQGKEAKKEFTEAYHEIRQGHVGAALVDTGKALEATNNMVSKIPLIGSIPNKFFEAGKHTIQGGIAAEKTAVDLVHGDLKNARKDGWSATKHFGNAVLSAAEGTSNTVMTAGMFTGAGTAEAAAGKVITKIALGELGQAGFFLQNAKSTVTGVKNTALDLLAGDKRMAVSDALSAVGGVAGMAATQAIVIMPGAGGWLGKGASGAASKWTQKGIMKAGDVIGKIVKKEKGGEKALKTIQNNKLAQIAIQDGVTGAAFGTQFAALDGSYAVMDLSQRHDINKQMKQLKADYATAQASGDQESMTQISQALSYLKEQKRNTTLKALGDGLMVGTDILSQGKKGGAPISIVGSLGAAGVGNSGTIMTANKDYKTAVKQLEQDLAAGASAEQIQYDRLEVERSTLEKKKALKELTGMAATGVFLGKKGGMQATMAIGQMGQSIYQSSANVQKEIDQISKKQDAIVEQANQAAQAASEAR